MAVRLGDLLGEIGDEEIRNPTHVVLPGEAQSRFSHALTRRISTNWSIACRTEVDTIAEVFFSPDQLVMVEKESGQDRVLVRTIADREITLYLEAAAQG